jgi:hypothetical protein
LSGLVLWADMLIARNARRGWPACFPPGPALHGALSSAFGQIELRGFGGSAFRSMYADFLEQAAAILNNPSLKDIAARFRECEKSWHFLTGALLPDEIPILRETRSLLTRRFSLSRKNRSRGTETELISIRDRLAVLRNTPAAAWSLTSAGALDLFAGLRRRILEIEAAERAAFTELQRTV